MASSPTSRQAQGGQRTRLLVMSGLVPLSPTAYPQVFRSQRCGRCQARALPLSSTTIYVFGQNVTETTEHNPAIALRTPYVTCPPALRVTRF